MALTQLFGKQVTFFSIIFFRKVSTSSVHLSILVQNDDVHNDKSNCSKEYTRVQDKRASCHPKNDFFLHKNLFGSLISHCFLSCTK